MVKHFAIRIGAALSIVLCLTISQAGGLKPDPVVLTFSSKAGDLKMELGFVRELQLKTTGDKYAIRIIFENEGVRYYNRFAFQYREMPTDLYICKEKVFSYSNMPYLKNDSFYLPNIASKEKAEKLMDTIFYGTNCENYLNQNMHNNPPVQNADKQGR